MKLPKENPTTTRILLFKQKWDERYNPEDYTPIWSFDSKMMSELREVPLDTIAERLEVYMNRTDDWIINSRHSLNAFVRNFNRFIPEKKYVRPIQPNTDWFKCGDCHSVFKTENEYSQHECMSEAHQ